MRFRQSERVRQTEPWGTVRAERSGSRLTERVASNGARLADITALFLPKSSQTRSVRHKSLRWGRRCGGGSGGVWQWRGAREPLRRRGQAGQLAELGKAPTRARGGGGVRVCHAGCGGDGGKAPAGGGRRQGATHRPARVRQSPDPSVSTEAGAFWC